MHLSVQPILKHLDNRENSRVSCWLQAVNDMETIVGTIHYGGEYPDNLYAGCKQSSGIDFSDDFHTYAIEWHKEEMSW